MGQSFIEDRLENLQRRLGDLPPLVGVGERALPRMGPAIMTKDYRILCCRYTGDLDDLRRLVRIDCLEGPSQPSDPPCSNTLGLLSHPLLKERGELMPKGDERLVIYQETPELHQLARRRRWKLLANPYTLRRRWEDKAWFRSRLKRAGIPVPPTSVIPRRELHRDLLIRLRRGWGRPLFLQIPDFPRGGGRATLGIMEYDPDELPWEIITKGIFRGRSFERVMISPRVPGPSVSLAGCVTGWGVLLSPLQRQLVDLADVLPPSRGGCFCGHQWGTEQFSEEIQKASRKTAQWVGEALLSEGYRGIFGIDFVYDEEGQRLLALECNPRLTAAFPTLTYLQWAKRVPPLEAYHLLSLLDPRGDLSPRGLDEDPEEMEPAAQLLLFHRNAGGSILSEGPSPGRYRWSPSDREPVRVGPPLPFPRDPDPFEFILLDGPFRKGTRVQDLERIVRIVFRRYILLWDDSLAPWVRGVILWTYEKLGLSEKGKVGRDR